ncbi:MAG: menaquinone biosynthesis protein [Desulfobulbaceae bacterium]|nr:menaquinone biosynthesis protein [Desulfobulbaceae bacterium]
MKHSKEAIAKIGIINFINTAPVCETWKRTVKDQNWEMVEGLPVALSKKLADGHLDLGLVSSCEYARHPKKYRILSGLSISANGSADSAGSVFLFSHVPLNQLDQASVLLSSQCETSVALVKIILEEFKGINPDYIVGDVGSVEMEQHKACLVSGDDALRLVATSTYLYQFDLADIWKRETGLPFVFEVCVVREEFCHQHQGITDEIHKELLRCRDEGIDAIKEICTVAAGRIPMPVSSCVEYLQTLEYDFDAQKQRALGTFFDYLMKRGEIEEDALPLQIYSNLC